MLLLRLVKTPHKFLSMKLTIKIKQFLRTHAFRNKVLPLAARGFAVSHCMNRTYMVASEAQCAISTPTGMPVLHAYICRRAHSRAFAAGYT